MSSGDSSTDPKIFIPREEVFPRQREPLENSAKESGASGKEWPHLHDGESTSVEAILGLLAWPPDSECVVRHPIWRLQRIGHLCSSNDRKGGSALPSQGHRSRRSRARSHCGSGTTATVAEQWGRRWITIDTSRVALALARARIMGARYPLLSVACTRARDHLLVTGVTPVSEFLDDFTENSQGLASRG